MRWETLIYREQKTKDRKSKKVPRPAIARHEVPPNYCPLVKNNLATILNCSRLVCLDVNRHRWMYTVRERGGSVKLWLQTPSVQCPVSRNTVPRGCTKRCNVAADSRPNSYARTHDADLSGWYLSNIYNGTAVIYESTAGQYCAYILSSLAHYPHNVADWQFVTLSAILTRHFRFDEQFLFFLLLDLDFLNRCLLY